MFMECNTVLLTQILSPVQAALLMLQCWPAHCDCFGFANYIASEVRIPLFRASPVPFQSMFCSLIEGVLFPLDPTVSCWHDEPQGIQKAVILLYCSADRMSLAGDTPEPRPIF